MSKLVRGTQGLKNTVILREPEGGVQRIRCPKCQLVAAPCVSTTGQNIYQCGGCGTQYKSVNITV